MKETKGLLDQIKQHEKLNIKVSSNAHNPVPESILNQLLQPHKTSYYLFVFVERGTAHHKIDLLDIAVSDGQLLFLLPNQIHTPPATKENLEYFKLVLDDHCLALLPQTFLFLLNPLKSQIITFDEASRARVKAVFAMIHQLLHSDKIQSEVDLILAHLNTLLTELNSAYFKSTDHATVNEDKLSKYLEFQLAVETHLTEQHSIESIAKKLAVSTNGLYTLVKEFSGVSPKEFITHRLILEAQRKLHYSKPTVKELAYELGFNDPAYFSRLFKKSTGKSVSQYLAALQDL